MFFTKNEQKLNDEYLHQGYIIRPVADEEALNWIQKQYEYLICNELEIVSDGNLEELLNKIHKRVPVSQLNSFRLKIIDNINKIKNFREMYFRIARPFLEILVSNELVMQRRINLSIQYPSDESSLLPVHADTWSGDSAFEVVVWLPLVNCYKSKSMYILTPNSSKILHKEFPEQLADSSEALYQAIKQDVQWLEIKSGEVLIFNQTLPHGNRVNEEKETRWSMNCRFKNVFSPYGDKKIGEFFEPVTLRAASRVGMSYLHPRIK